MEYVKIEGFLGKAISRFINKLIESKVGYKPNIMVNKFNLQTDIKPENRDELVVVNMTVTMKQSDFEKLIEEATV